MAEPLKHFYSPSFFNDLSSALTCCIPGFPERKFIHCVFTSDWTDLELKQRCRRVTESLHKFLPEDFTKAVEQILCLSNHYLSKPDKGNTFPLIFLPEYIELYGLNHFKQSMAALAQITQLVSAEFAIRPFIIKYPNETMVQMRKWTKHKNPHVRRLASEGCRPRLPWASALPEFKADPSPILPILEALKKDQSEYVRRSVANNLNDIAKDHPDVVLKIVRKWNGISKETDWILKHASRTLLKKGDAEALALHGFNPNAKSTVSLLELSRAKIKIGETVTFTFAAKNQDKKKSKLRIEYAITYRTSTGKPSRKVFQVAEKKFGPGEKIQFSKKQRFTDFTTRKHYPGKHLLQIIVNGSVKSEAPFTLIN